MHHATRYLWTAGLLAALTACGGSSGSGSTASVVTGVAATGLAISGGTVSLKCVSGTASYPATGTDGSFSIDVSGVTLPCVARVNFKDASGTAQQLHSFVSAAGNVNITPITELLVAKLTGAAAANAFDTFNAALLKAISATQLSDASKAVKAYLAANLGMTVTNLPDDFVGTKFKPKTATTAGDAFDGVLDDFKVKLGAKSLADAEGEVIIAGGNGGTAGYAATATFTGKLSDGSACTVDVAADHSVSVSAASWAYTGGSIKTMLDGFYFDNANGEIAPAVFYSGTRRFFESNAGNYQAATAAAPAYNTGLSFDATSGKLIMASGSVITDTSFTPAAGANFNFVCAGEAYPAGTPVGVSEFNKATPSRFKASTLVGGPFTAPTANNQACTFSVDATGNASISWAGFTTTGGKLDLPNTWLTGAADQSTTQAKYDIYYSKTTGAIVGTSMGGSVMLTPDESAGSDWFSVTISQSATNKQAVVLANGLASNPKSVTCNTANDPAGKWAQVASYIGTWKGTKDNNFHLGTNATCQLVVDANGAMTYTDTAGAATTINSTAWTVTPPNSGAYFDFAKTGTAITFSMDFTGTTVSGAKPQAYFWKSGASTEYCNNMIKQ